MFHILVFFGGLIDCSYNDTVDPLPVLSHGRNWVDHIHVTVLACFQLELALRPVC